MYFDITVLTSWREHSVIVLLPTEPATYTDVRVLEDPVKGKNSVWSCLTGSNDQMHGSDPYIVQFQFELMEQERNFTADVGVVERE